MRIKLVVLVLAASVLFMGCKGLTSPSPEEFTEREMRMLQYLQCFSNAQGMQMQVNLKLFDKARPVGTGYVACGTWPDSPDTECWRSWLNGKTVFGDIPDSELRNAAAHETGHRAGHWDCEDASVVQKQLLDRGACP
jgi:hypothetical protein